MKRFFFLFCFFLVASNCNAGCPTDEVTLSHESDFQTVHKHILEHCFFHISLGKDFSFEQGAFQPLGTGTDGDCTPFNGTIKGNGHTLRGIQVDNQQGPAGLFCGIETATVENLVFDETCSFKGNRVGTLTATVTKSLVVRNVTSRALLSGTISTGGFVAVLDSKDSVSLKFSHCVNEGALNENNQMIRGGFIGLINSTKRAEVSIENCVNNAVHKLRLEHDTHVGGFIGLVENNSELRCSIQNSINRENMTISNDGKSYGGFFGTLKSNQGSMIFIDNCTNDNPIVTTTQNSGGFIGYVNDNSFLSISINGSVNSWDITSSKTNPGYAGGFIGKIDNDNGLICELTYNTDLGKINASKQTGYIGGFIAALQYCKDCSLVVDACINENEITVSLIYHDGLIGGIIGYVMENEKLNISVSHHVTSKNEIVKNTYASNYVGGLIGKLYRNKKTALDFMDNKMGAITKGDSFYLCSVGGFIGDISDEQWLQLRMENNDMYGIVSGYSQLENSFVGGFIGSIRNSPFFTATIQNSTLQSIVDGSVANTYCSVGGLIGEVDNCSNMSLTSTGWQSNTCSIEMNVKTEIRQFGYFGGIVGRILNCNNATVSVANGINSCRFGAKGEIQTVGGGLFGQLSSNNQTNIIMDNMTNNREFKYSRVTEKIHCGGIIGQISDSWNDTLTITNTVNNGPIIFDVDLVVNIAGFIGYCGTLTSTTIYFENCSNKGIIQTNSANSNVGGFIGQLSQNDDIHFSFLRVLNTGFINGTSNSGGFIGNLEDCSSVSISMIGAFNDGAIYANSSAGHSAGFIGAISSASSTNISLINCANRGVVSSNYISCGFVCHSLKEESNVFLENCVNRENVIGTVSYGITNTVSNAINIVVLGNVSGTNSFLFWEKEKHYSPPYALSGANANQLEIIYLKQHPMGCMYLESNATKHADDVLNDNSILQQYGMGWTSDLDLIQGPRVTLGAPVNSVEYVAPNCTLSCLLKYQSHSSHNYTVSDRFSHNIVDDDFLITANLDLVVVHNISINGLVNVSLFVEHGKQLQSIQALEPFWDSDSYIISDNENKMTKHNRTTTVVGPMQIVVANSATVEIVFDDGIGANDDEIEEAIKNKIGSEGNTISNIEIIRNKDGTTIAMITVVEQDVDSITKSLSDCLS